MAIHIFRNNWVVGNYSNCNRNNEIKRQSGGGIGRRIGSVKLAENEVTNMNEWFKCNNEQPTEITGSNPVLTTSV